MWEMCLVMWIGAGVRGSILDEGKMSLKLMGINGKQNSM